MTNLESHVIKDFRAAKVAKDEFLKRLLESAPEFSGPRKTALGGVEFRFYLDWCSEPPDPLIVTYTSHADETGTVRLASRHLCGEWSLGHVDLQRIAVAIKAHLGQVVPWGSVCDHLDGGLASLVLAEMLAVLRKRYPGCPPATCLFIGSDRAEACWPNMQVRASVSSYDGEQYLSCRDWRTRDYPEFFWHGQDWQHGVPAFEAFVCQKAEWLNYLMSRTSDTQMMGE